MNVRSRRSLAATAVLSVTAAMGLVALTGAPAIAGTGGGALMCKSTTLSPAPGPLDTPFVVNVTASPTGPRNPVGDTIALTNATVALTLPGPVVGGIVAGSNGATAISLNNLIVELDATNSTGTIQASGLTSPSQAVTGYSATGGPGGVPTADAITYVVSGVNLGTLTTAGTNGGSVDIQMAADSAGSGLIIGLTGGLAPSLGFGSLNNAFGGPGGGGTCFNDATSAGSGVPWSPVIASVALADPAPVVTTAPSYGSVAGISNALSVTATDGGGAGIDPSTWAISSGPTCTGPGGNGSATISGTATGATVSFTAPNNAATCTIGVTVSDGITTSAEAVLNVNVVAGDSLQQNVDQVVNPGTLDLLACGTSTPDPATCSVTMSPITLNGSDQATTGAINRVTVVDARGVPVGWSLTAQLQGDLVNQNASLDPTDPNTRIASNLLTISPSCSVAADNSNAVPTTGAASQSLNAPAAVCSAVAGQNTGTSFADGSLDLTVPASAYSGTYVGTINFVVS